MKTLPDRRMVAAGLLALPFGGLLSRAAAQKAPPPGGMRGPPPPGKPYVFESAIGPNGQCVLIPEETEGPYPVDLFDNGKIHRRDVREDRIGIPLDLELAVMDVRNACAPIAGARVDMWQCDKDGIYSGVQNMALAPGARSDDTRGQTFLRGIQTTDAQGRARFVTIFPGWYPSRLTHIHFQVYLPDKRVVTSQIAFKPELVRAVYDSLFYREHGQNTVVTSLAADNVFGDDLAKYQMIALQGDLRQGFKGTLPVAVAGGSARS